MSSMESKDIVSIIKACKNSGVKSVKYEGLELEFSENLTNLEKSDNNSPKTVLINKVQDAPVSQLIEQIETEDDEGFMPVTDEFAMQNLMINEPEKFEEYQRELNNGRS